MSNDMSTIEKVCQLLSENGHEQSLLQINNLIKDLNSSQSELRKSAAKQLKEMCHIRWLGDIYIESVSHKEWWSLLEKLKRFANKKCR